MLLKDLIAKYDKPYTVKVFNSEGPVIELMKNSGLESANAGIIKLFDNVIVKSFHFERVSCYDNYGNNNLTDVITVQLY